jgi:hypothetical protein
VLSSQEPNIFTSNHRHTSSERHFHSAKVEGMIIYKPEIIISMIEKLKTIKLPSKQGVLLFSFSLPQREHIT